MTPAEKTESIAQFLVNYYKKEGNDVTIEQARDIAENQLSDQQKKQIVEYIQMTGSDGSDAGKEDEEYMKTPLTGEEEGVIKNGKYTGIILTIIPEHPNTIFDTEHFVWLVRESVALELPDKKDILLGKLPGLNQNQIDSLTKIFEDEQVKLKKLDKTYPGELAKLKDKHLTVWARWEWELSPEKKAQDEEREKQLVAARAQEEEEKKKLADMQSALNEM